MFNLSYLSPSKIMGVIKVNKPIWSLGNIKDIDGNMWNIGGIINNYVLAIPLDAINPYFNDTSGQCYYGPIFQKWLPYDVEVVKQ